MTKNPTSGKKSLKFSKKIQNAFGGKVPSIYETQLGDLYCTLNWRKIYLGRDPKATKAKLLQILTDAAQTQLPRPAQPIVEKSELSPSPAAFAVPVEPGSVPRVPVLLPMRGREGVRDFSVLQADDGGGVRKGRSPEAGRVNHY